MVKEESFGVIPIKGKEGRRELLLVKHRAGHWGFPKGRPLEGENSRETACRELKEETDIEIISFLEVVPIIDSYTLIREGRKIEKSVTYYLALVEGNASPDLGEIIEVRWCSLTQARQLLTYNKGLVDSLQILLDSLLEPTE